MMEIGAMGVMIIAIAELLKKRGLPPAITPLLNVVLGVGLSVLHSGLSVEVVLHGLVLGLAVCGVYDCTQIVQKLKS